jgi:hypothetical protein
MVRSSVLLPDMLEPLTMNSRASSPSAMSLPTAWECGSKGCVSPSARKQTPSSAISGNG